MIQPDFSFDADMNGYLSVPFAAVEEALVHIELTAPAPVVTLKMESDGGYANYGQTPELSDGYEIQITLKDDATLRLATPVEVKNCYVLN